MTIVEKVINLLQVNKTMNLKEIYESLPEHTKSSIRGNINRYPNRWFMKNCEYVLFCRKGKAKSINEPSSQTVHRFNNIIGNKIHETEKPLDLLRMYIRNSTNIGDMILDPFAGSGSTCLAALLEQRKCTTIEIDENYITKIVNRLKYYFKNGTDFRLAT